MPKFYLDTEEKGKGYIVGWMGRLQKTMDGQNNRKGGSATPPIEGDDFSFAASSAVVQPSILQVQKPSDRLGDFTVVRASDASYTDSSGVIQIAPDNVARIDYSQNVAELLTEPQSTNLITYSEDFSDGSWSKTNATITDNASTSPDGSLSMSKLVEDSSNAIHILAKFNTWSVEELTCCIYVKKAERNLVISNASSSTNAVYFNINNGVIDAEQGDMTGRMTLFSPDVYKCEVTYTAAASNTLGIGMYETWSGSSSSQTYQGDGVSGIYIWGAQLEELPYATSYIPTNGSTVTRLQDQITDGGNVNVINSEEGVLFFEGSALFDDTGENRYLSLSDGTENNVINISYNTNGALIQFLINAGGALILSHAQPAVDITTNAKIAVKWKVNDFAIWINGAEVDTVLSGVVPTGLNSVNLSNAVGANYFNTRIKAIKVYDRALTDEEITEITTL